MMRRPATLPGFLVGPPMAPWVIPATIHVGPANNPCADAA